jgi:hypothetical protein
MVLKMKTIMQIFTNDFGNPQMLATFEI